MVVTFVSVLSLLIAVTSTYADGIQNGTAYRYYVSIEDSDGEHMCGGALIGEDLVLSSTRCLVNYNYKQLFVRVGSGAVIAVKGSYRDKSSGLIVKNKIGMLRLAKPVTESASIGIIKVATSEPKTGETGMVVFVGSGNRVDEAPVSVIAATYCTEYIGRGDVNSDTEVCGLSKSDSACDMSSGSPLVVNNELVGVVSWGYGCARKYTPAVYMNVAAFNSWIEINSKKL